jgi:hypothetical protein
MRQQPNGKRKSLLDKTTFVLMAAVMLILVPAAIELHFARSADRALHPQQLAYGGHAFDREDNALPNKITNASYVTFFERGVALPQSVPNRAEPSGAAAPLVSGSVICGRGRYRDSANGKCVGPADSID